MRRDQHALGRATLANEFSSEHEKAGVTGPTRSCHGILSVALKDAPIVTIRVLTNSDDHRGCGLGASGTGGLVRG